MEKYDLIIIGAGAGGITAAIEASSLGLKVALVEKEERIGGAFILTGTIPSKTIRETSVFLDEYKNRNLYGIDLVLKEGLTIRKIMKREKDVVRKRIKEAKKRIYLKNVKLYNGFGTFLDKNKIKILKKNKKSEIIYGSYIIISTGSKPKRNPLFPFDENLIYDSDSILKLNEIPKSLCIIGAGTIGLEYASIFSLLGIKVSVIDSRKKILSFLDFEIVDRLIKNMKERGIKFYLGKELKGLKKKKKSITLTLSDNKEVNSSKLLVCLGRIGNTENLSLEKVGVQKNERGLIKVNSNFQTSISNIYAIGDVIGKPALASTAMEQGRLVVDYIFNKKYENTLPSILPYAIYTVPEISMVGLTEDFLKEKGISYGVGRADYLSITKGSIIGDERGLIKLLVSKRAQEIKNFDLPNYLAQDKKIKKNQLLGVHIIGENASEIIHIGLACLYYHGTIDYFLQSVFNFPTLSDGFKIASYDYFSKNK